MHVCLCVVYVYLTGLVNLWTVYLLIIYFHRIKLLTNINIYSDKCDCVTPKTLVHRKGESNIEPVLNRNISFVYVRVRVSILFDIIREKNDTEAHERTTQDVHVIIVIN